MSTKSRLLRLAVSAVWVSVPLCIFAAAPHQDKQDKDARVTYHFKSQDKAQLRPHYLADHPEMKKEKCWAWHHGVNLPDGWRDRVEPLADADIASLAPPPPPGYEFGYFDGWAVVYDPHTGVVLDAVNLM
jgi:Ni/Co efflux regulator RcnB